MCQRHISQGASAGSALAASAGASSGGKDPEKGKSGVYLGVHYPKPLYFLLSMKHRKEIVQNKSRFPAPLPSADTIPVVKEWLNSLKMRKQSGNPQGGDGSKSNKRQNKGNRRWKRDDNDKFDNLCSSVEGISKTVGSNAEKLGSLNGRVAKNDKNIKTLATSVKETLGAVGALAGEVESVKKGATAGSASARPANARNQIAEDTPETRSHVKRGLDTINKFLEEQGGSP